MSKTKYKKQNKIIITIRKIIIMMIIVIIITIIIIIKHGWSKNNQVSIQHINLYELSEVTASIIKYTSILITVCKNWLTIC